MPSPSEARCPKNTPPVHHARTGSPPDAVSGAERALRVVPSIAECARRSGGSRAAVRAAHDDPLTVNGTRHRLEVEDRWTLVELLRDHLG